MNNLRTLSRFAAVPAAAAALTLAVAAPASAHVTATPTETAAGAYTVVSFSVGHGCEGSPTTEIAISMPESVYAVTPTRNPLYEVEKSMEQLDEPIADAHGNEITQRVDQVVYTAITPLPDGERDTFELSLQLPADAAGETLAFPTVQTCEKGENPWTEVAEEGADEPEFPAPVVSVTEATDDGHGHDDADDAGDTGDTGDDEAHDTDHAADADSDDSDSDSDGIGIAIAGLVAGVLGLTVGGVALARTRGRGQA
ncbi:MAG: YcnI family protein [Nocardioides sp.]